jgi:hypothetical protein
LAALWGGVLYLLNREFFWWISPVLGPLLFSIPLSLKRNLTARTMVSAVLSVKPFGKERCSAAFKKNPVAVVSAAGGSIGLKASEPMEEAPNISKDVMNIAVTFV